ncbi:SusC/RagA family TonB-linked outer membrane protein [Pedobacter sp. HMWF019]|uniref:SusC/RagA family TonB-linked outer membrane protein n=1 Tax=Pedobacter sp. HMWF019 TaxID=2056856 RepID=UPI000D36D89D|nr:TonB-dependent receptor [Pedobacter sp. HMWF019]PTS91375.1 SusC/RagA family TonB-linked outer membrane protein [Pedobacter sp. HMWF019]
MNRRLRAYSTNMSFEWCPVWKSTLFKKSFITFVACISLLMISFAASAQQAFKVTGTVKDESGETLIGVSVKIKNGKGGATTDKNGNYSVNLDDKNATLVFIYVGYDQKEVEVNGRSQINVSLKPAANSLEDVVVVGYGTQKKEAITGAIATITSKDFEKVHGGSTVSTGLAGKLPGVSFRMPDGRPGSSAAIQIRNMGDPLYVIDGIQQDAGQFNNISPTDIESITVLKDASAAIYGSRSANGVIIVTTKKGTNNSRNTFTVDAYTGWQNWVRFPETTNAYQWMLGKATAELNSAGKTDITRAELEKWKAGTEYGYQSQNWKDLIIVPNAPQYSVNLNASGGTDKITYYLSATHLDQKAVYGKEREFDFNRTNIQSNVEAKISDRFKVNMLINGRIETRDQPGVPGGDDYWAARFALLRNRPTELAYANGNPLYPNDIGHNTEQFAVQSKALTGYWKSDWRVLQTNLSATYDTPITGLSIKGLYSYYIADNVVNGHEYTYNVYTYHPDTDTYEEKVGSSNPYRERRNEKVITNTYQLQATYNRTFGKHTVGGILLAERLDRFRTYTFQHAVPQTNVLPVLQFADMDGQDFADIQEEEARIGYVSRLNYNYANKYYLEVSGRRDASWKFAPDRRVGYFPSASIGWRITQEGFMKSLLGENPVLDDLKFRASYGQLGDDKIDLDPFAYLPGYNYNAGTVILDGKTITTSRDKGPIVNNLTWFKSRITDIGADFSLFKTKLTGTFDYFYRKRTGLRGTKNDILVPAELGYNLSDENVNSDAQYGGEFSLNYQNKIGEFGYNVGGNFSLSRSKFLESYKPRFNNSLDQYRNSIENRYNNIFWGYEVTGQFKSVDEINNYKVNIDGKGNSTLLPGDLIYKDQNGDGVIDGYDERPIGYTTTGQPNIMFGFSIGLSYKNFDFSADFSGGSLYSWNQNYEQRWAFQNTGALLQSFADDSWHRTDPYDLNSPWVAGKYPALRFNEGGHSNYNRNSTFWLHNVRYLRARTIEFGYTLPKRWLEKIKVQNARVYLNGYNLFSIDNLKSFGVDPEIADDNGLQYPQNKFFNIGIKLAL